MNEPICETDGNGDKRWWLNNELVEMEDVLTDPKDQFWWRMKS